MRFTHLVLGGVALVLLTVGCRFKSKSASNTAAAEGVYISLTLSGVQGDLQVNGLDTDEKVTSADIKMAPSQCTGDDTTKEAKCPAPSIQEVIIVTTAKRTCKTGPMAAANLSVPATCAGGVGSVTPTPTGSADLADFICCRINGKPMALPKEQLSCDPPADFQYVSSTDSPYMSEQECLTKGGLSSGGPSPTSTPLAGDRFVCCKDATGRHAHPPENEQCPAETSQVMNASGGPLMSPYECLAKNL